MPPDIYKPKTNHKIISSAHPQPLSREGRGEKKKSAAGILLTERDELARREFLLLRFLFLTREPGMISSAANDDAGSGAARERRDEKGESRTAGEQHSEGEPRGGHRFEENGSPRVRPPGSDESMIEDGMDDCLTARRKRRRMAG